MEGGKFWQLTWPLHLLSCASALLATGLLVFFARKHRRAHGFLLKACYWFLIYACLKCHTREPKQHRPCHTLSTCTTWKALERHRRLVSTACLAGAKIPLAFIMWACLKYTSFCTGLGNFISSVGAPVYPVRGIFGMIFGWWSMFVQMDQAAYFCCICRLVQP